GIKYYLISSHYEKISEQKQGAANPTGEKTVEKMKSDFNEYAGPGGGSFLLPPDQQPAYRASVKRRSITPSPGALANLSNLQQPRTPSPTPLPSSNASVNKSGSLNVKPRSRSQGPPRFPEIEDEKISPRKKFGAAASASLMSIPNAVKLSMLSSGFISINKVSKEDNRMLSSSLPKKPVTKEQFLRLCEERRKFPVLYKVEFQIACKNEAFSSRHASKPANKEKNQNQKTIPYDYNRVVLEPSKQHPGDYVNASFVDSLLKPNAYLVCQGPLEETVCDFWRMVWQKHVSCIIMLTKTFDFIRVMCHQYWPVELNTPTSIEGFTVTIDHEERLANFYIRTMTVKNDDEPNQPARNILQFHYSEWPGHTVPFPTALLDFRRRVRNIIEQSPEYSKGQMLVHCNDGGGRSGVFCQVDAQLELLEEDNLIDVFGFLKKLKSSRKGLLENVEQLKFVYDTLEEYVICGKTWFPVSELSSLLKHKSMKDPHTKINEYQKEFLLICKQTPRFSIGDCAGGHRADNRDKNRDVLIIPRQHVHGLHKRGVRGRVQTGAGYMVTEWPQSHTISYLWSLVYDYDVSAVVVLANPEPNAHYPSFWPEGKKSIKYGPVFTIDPLASNVYPNIKTWIFRINKKIVSLQELMAGVKADPKTCQLFQLTCWPIEQKVPMSTNSLVELMNMVERWRAKQGMGPVVVVSPDGHSRSGVYCAANACIEQVITYGEVDIFTAVKTVRRHRPQMIENMTEYKYCYDVVLHYVLHYLNEEIKDDALPPLMNKLPGVHA
ncbi:Receptor-type tyrosine-protein phosphatase kappa, partial [Orchesella cincta]